MTTMITPIAMNSALPSVVGDGSGTDVAIDNTDVTVNITGSVVEVGRLVVGVGVGRVAVAFWVWVGVTDVAGTTTGVLVGGTDVGTTGVSVLTRVGTV